MRDEGEIRMPRGRGAVEANVRPGAQGTAPLCRFVVIRNVGTRFPHTLPHQAPGTDTNHAMEGGFTSLYVACGRGHSASVKLLLEVSAARELQQPFTKIAQCCDALSKKSGALSWSSLPFYANVFLGPDSDVA